MSVDTGFRGEGLGDRAAVWSFEPRGSMASPVLPAWSPSTGSRSWHHVANVHPGPDPEEDEEDEKANSAAGTTQRA